MMRILWILSSGWREGGAENYAAALKPVLEREGHTVRILASDDRQDMPQFSDYQFRAHRGPLRAIFHMCNFSAYRILKRVLAEFEPDLVHIHTIGHASPIILFPLKSYPTIVTAHGPEGFIKSLVLFCFPRSYFKDEPRTSSSLKLIGKCRLIYHKLVGDPLYRRGFRNVDAIIAPSRHMQTVLSGDGYDSTVIPNGVSLFPYHAVAKETLSRQILYCGRLEAYKGVEYLLRAFAEIRARFPDARLAIAGDGSHRLDLIRLADDLLIADAVEFLGHLDAKQVERAYAASAVAVMPSTEVETFGNSGIEAMSIGRPVIASRVGGITDWLIDGKTGCLIEPRNPRAISDAVIRLFSDQDTLLSMMKASRNQAEKFDLKIHADHLMDFYSEVILRYARMK